MAAYVDATIVPSIAIRKMLSIMELIWGKRECLSYWAYPGTSCSGHAIRVAVLCTRQMRLMSTIQYTRQGEGHTTVGIET